MKFNIIHPLPLPVFTMKTEMPEEGQFVAMWSYGGVVWSDTFKIEFIDGQRVMYKYNNAIDAFQKDSWFPNNEQILLGYFYVAN